MLEMKKLPAVILVLVLCAPLVADESLFTMRFANGRWWDTQPEVAREAYVKGYLDSVQPFTPIKKLIDQCHCVTADTTAGVNGFYRLDQSYARLPVTFAIREYLERVTGTSVQTIRKESSDFSAALSGVQ